MPKLDDFYTKMPLGGNKCGKIFQKNFWQSFGSQRQAFISLWPPNMFQKKNAPLWKKTWKINNFSKDFTIAPARELQRVIKYDQILKTNIFFCVCRIKMILTAVIIYDYIFHRNFCFLKLANFTRIYAHFCDFGRNFKKFDLKWGACSIAMKLPNFKKNFFSNTSETSFFAPQVLFSYLV